VPQIARAYWEPSGRVDLTLNYTIRNRRAVGSFVETVQCSITWPMGVVTQLETKRVDQPLSGGTVHSFSRAVQWMVRDDQLVWLTRLRQHGHAAPGAHLARGQSHHGIGPTAGSIAAARSVPTTRSSVSTAVWCSSRTARAMHTRGALLRAQRPISSGSAIARSPSTPGHPMTSARSSSCSSNWPTRSTTCSHLSADGAGRRSVERRAR